MVPGRRRHGRPAPLMDVSVIVCTYNRAASLDGTLKAIADQLTPPGLAWELLVVDNNSVDGTRQVIDAFAATGRIRLHYLFEPRQGLSHARNAGIGRAKGAIVAFTDDDVIPNPDWITCVATCLKETGADIMGGRILPLWEHAPPPWLAARPRLRYPFAIMDHPVASPVVDARGIPNVWGANMAFRREVFARIGLFDPSLGVAGRKLYRGEELELVRRALAAGSRAVYDPRSVVRHRITAARMRRRYVSRLSFEQAEGEALTQAPRPGRRWFGTPLFMYRKASSRLGSWLWAAARRRPDAFDRWLVCCEILGTIWGQWKRHFRARARRP
jgi:glucosyl-dolichyl phosphate glucuronosyltransferase